ncbi:MAG: protein adenylyltransferase SelO family protein, partial [Pseudomonadota bacterium]
NMSILGVTFDYGPFAFFDEYDAHRICNHSDHAGRYAFHRQPHIGLWNLHALAQAFSPLVPREQLIELLQGYEGIFNGTFSTLMHNKLGLRASRLDDHSLLQELLDLMQESKVDYPRFFRQLCDIVTDTDNTATPAKNIRDHITNRERFDVWLARYRARLDAEGSVDQERAARMRRVNPKYVLRNWLLQVAIDKANSGDYSEVNLLLKVAQQPFDEWPEHERLAALPPDWSKHMEISCSS